MAATKTDSGLKRMKHRFLPFFFRFFTASKPAFACPICGYDGPFKNKVVSKSPDLVRLHSKCPGCGSNERHRMLFLVFREVFSRPGAAGRVLHIAPEACLRPVLAQHATTYQTADLFKQDVDFNEDIQKMSFADASYDSVVVSRVLTIPPDFDASIRETRRILKPGGVAIIAEVYGHEKNREFGQFINARSREIGVDALDLYRKHFAQVELFFSDRYDARHQLHNLMQLNGQPKDDYPEIVRLPGRGFKDLVAVCRA